MNREDETHAGKKKKTVLHLEILKENNKIILLKCILCLLYCIPASADLIFFFQNSTDRKLELFCKSPLRIERLILHYASKSIIYMEAKVAYKQANSIRTQETAEFAHRKKQGVDNLSLF